MAKRLRYIKLVEISGQPELEPPIGNSTVQKSVAGPVFQERGRVDMPDRRSVTVKDGAARTQRSDCSRCLLLTAHLLVPWCLIQLQPDRSQRQRARREPARSSDQGGACYLRLRRVQPDSDLRKIGTMLVKPGTLSTPPTTAGRHVSGVDSLLPCCRNGYPIRQAECRRWNVQQRREYTPQLEGYRAFPLLDLAEMPLSNPDSSSHIHLRPAHCQPVLPNSRASIITSVDKPAMPRT
jgi:hypothetical protein